MKINKCGCLAVCCGGKEIALCPIWWEREKAGSLSKCGMKGLIFGSG
jgi:hypothetical protein